jgi:hypothetical protein
VVFDWHAGPSHPRKCGIRDRIPRPAYNG